VAALGALCRDHGARLIVDGVQGAGVIAAPLAELGADAVVCGGHKGMLSLAGAGFMYVREDLIGNITPPYAAKYSFISNDRTQDNPTLAADAHRFEYGNPNYLGIWVQGRSAEYLTAIGLENIEARIRDLTTRLIEGAGERGITVRTPRAWRERASIVSFEIEGNVEAITAALAERNIIVSEKDGHIRASVQFYNNEEDVERFLDAVTSISPS
jgi:selenocysteine lyase/cysteine desulfurase